MVTIWVTLMENSKSCQLQVVYESGKALTPVDYARRLALRLNRAFKRRLIRYFSTMEVVTQGTASIINKTANILSSTPGELFEAGDFVEVLSMEEIRRTLDSNYRCGKLQFMPGMERFAGHQFTVLKNVRTIFDERAWKMVSVKNTVLLKDVICDGRDMYDKEGCDRCCYFFWKINWLRKLG